MYWYSQFNEYGLCKYRCDPMLLESKGSQRHAYVHN